MTRDHTAMKISDGFTVFKIWINVHCKKKLRQYGHLKFHAKTNYLDCNYENVLFKNSGDAENYKTRLCNEFMKLPGSRCVFQNLRDLIEKVF